MTKTAVPSVIILAAGSGTRMKSQRPKVLHQVASWPMIRHVIQAAQALNPCEITVVVAPNMEDVAHEVAPLNCVIQEVAKGTGDAVSKGLQAIKQRDCNVIVLCGDMPLITANTLQELMQTKKKTSSDLVIGGFYPEDMAAYGRIVSDEQGNVTAIVEAAEADSAQKAIRLCNSGLMLADAGLLGELIAELVPSAVKGEYYLTDVVALARKRGKKCNVVVVPTEEVLGVNTRADLAEAERLMQKRLRSAALDAGVGMIAPDTVWLAADTKFGHDVTLGTNVVFGSNVTVGDNVNIRSFSHIDQATIGNCAVIGPFARIRPGTVLAENVHVGNFVEVKNSRVKAGSKMNHLAYIGDAEVGENVNIGAGAITCNYDGFRKTVTEIGNNAFVGSNVALVAPVKIGNSSWVGAGSVITRDVPDGTLALARGTQTNLENWNKTKRKK